MTDPVQRLPAVTPTWATDPGTTLEPSAGEKAAGWDTNIRPPARWMNDYQRKVFQIVDNAAAMMRKDFRKIEIENGLFFGIDSGECPLAFHKGFWYLRDINGSERIFKSSDLKGWEFVSQPVSLGVDSLTIASDGSRMVFCASGAGTNSQYSDDDGDTYASNLVGTGADPKIFYLPVSGIWVGSSGTTNTIVSTDGITYAATDFVGFAFANGAEVAERTDGTLAVIGGSGGIYSVNGGANWLNTTNGVASGVDGYYYSALNGEIVGWDSAANFRKMTVAGTWDAAFAAMLPGFAIDGMFEIHGAMYAYGGWSDPATPGNPQTLAVAMSLDLGLTWEIVHQFSAAIAGPNRLAHLNFVAPVIGHRPGANTGFIGTIARTAAATAESIIPPYVGQEFAAPLAP